MICINFRVIGICADLKTPSRAERLSKPVAQQVGSTSSTFRLSKTIEGSTTDGDSQDPSALFVLRREKSHFPMSTHRNSTISFFDRHAEGYDDALLAAPSDRALRSYVQQQILEHLSPGDNALDFGCGTGLDALELAQAGLRITGIDISPGMLNLAERRFAAASEIPQPRWLTGGEEHLAKLQDEGQIFGAILTNFAVLNTIENPRAVIEAFAQLTASGGLVLVVVQNPLYWQHLLQSWWWRALPAAARTGTFVRRSARWKIETFQHLPQKLSTTRLPMRLRNFSCQWGTEVTATWPRRLFGRFFIMAWIRD